MISYDRSSPRTKLIGVAVLLAVAALGAVWWAQREGAPVSAPATSGSAPVDGQHASQLKKSADAMLTQPEVLPDGRPADFAPDEWASLKDAIAKNPNSASELKRVAEYLRFQRSFERWQSMQESPDAAGRHALGQKLMEVLPLRLTNKEVTFDEALMIGAALINDSEPTEQGRQQQLEALNVRLQQVAPRPDDEEQQKQDSCVAQWERQRSILTGEHLAKPPAQREREQKQFEAALEKARVEIFDAPECATKKQ
jgi:hypothetical protein